MGKFRPDNRKTTYRMIANESLKPPKIVFSTTALKWIRALMDEHDTEIGFYAIVDERGENEYYIRDVFYPKHELVTHGTCEISPEGETEIMQYLIDKDRTDDIQKIRFWGHKHPGSNNTSPSGQDETQAMERMNSTGAFLIRAICSGDEISTSFFDYDRQIRFDNVNWEVEESEAEAIISDKLDRVREVLNSNENTEVTAHEKFTNIATILTVDDEMSKIRAKVKELKDVNVPKDNGYTGHRRQTVHIIDKRGGCGNQHSYQTNLLESKPNMSTISGLSGKKVALLLDEVDQEIDSFYAHGGF